jgi:hypothetical protein
MTGHLSLYHYTCGHGATDIRKQDRIIPGVHLHGKDVGGARFAWFTDLAPPVPREAVGLTSLTLACDRTECVFTVDRDAPNIRRWVDVRRSHPDLWHLELAEGAAPMHWFVSEHPVPVLAEVTANPRGNKEFA